VWAVLAGDLERELIEALRPEFRIARINVKKGDTLVVRCPKDRHLSDEMRDQLREAVELVFPNTPCLILEDGLELATIRKEAV
jgi:hypothetical protein